LIRARLRRSRRVADLSAAIRAFLPGGAPGRDKGPRPAAEYGVTTLRRTGFVSSPRPEYRLNLVVPTVDGAGTFGGIRTALDLFEAIGADFDERRILTFGPIGPDAADTVPGYVPIAAGEDPALPRQLAVVDRSPAGRLAIRRGDVFVSTFWTTAELVGRIHRWQASTNGWAPARSAYIIQDYEPGFYAFSAQWLLARATYARTSETVAVFNTSSLRDYFDESGIRFDHAFAFEPRILPTLRAAIATPPTPRSRTIVVYGRPTTPRNAFAAIVDGLVAWRATDPDAGRWQVLSVGRPHPDIELGGGVLLHSAGKLDLDEYAALLRRAAIGVSLMVSPHPSYPPLEMAHLGMLVLTNRFGVKDLSAWHSNIEAIDDVSADALGAALSGLCRRFESDPAAGDAGRPLRTDFTDASAPFPMAPEVAALLRDGATPGLSAPPAAPDPPGTAPPR
jgi:hypothetical protein